MSEQTTASKGHPVRAILAGAVTGVVVVGALTTWSVLTWDLQPSWPWGGLYIVALMTGFCMQFVAAGALVALPAWAWLRSWGRGAWWEAALFGFLSTGGAVFAYLSCGSIVGIGVLPGSAAGGAIGALCWPVGWRAARA